MKKKSRRLIGTIAIVGALIAVAIITVSKLRVSTTSSDASGLPNNSTFVSQGNIPATMRVNETRNVQVTFRNTGQSTWTYGRYKVAPVPPSSRTWGYPLRANLNYRPRPSGESVPPGGSKTFDIPIMAPSSPGTYTIEWQMLEEDGSWRQAFGPRSPATSVVVTSGPGPANINVLPEHSPTPTPNNSRGFLPSDPPSSSTATDIYITSTGILFGKTQLVKEPNGNRMVWYDCKGDYRTPNWSLAALSTTKLTPSDYNFAFKAVRVKPGTSTHEYFSKSGTDKVTVRWFVNGQKVEDQIVTAPKSASILSITHALTIPSGTRSIGVEVDPDNAYKDSNRANNRKDYSVIVGCSN